MQGNGRLETRALGQMACFLANSFSKFTKIFSQWTTFAKNFGNGFIILSIMRYSISDTIT